MNAQILDLTIIRGLTYEPVLIIFKDSDGSQFDLSGWSVFSQARTSPNYRPSVDLKPLILDSGAPLYGTTGPGRVAAAAFTSDESSALTPNKLEHDMILQDPSGKRSGPYVVGNLIITDKNTQP